MLNKKYLPTKKNGYKPPKLEDERLKYVSIGCGNCEECLKKKSREWQVRLLEEIKQDKSGKFITLTFEDNELINLIEKVGFNESNAVAGYAVRHFLERWRKTEKTSVKHWLITELGQNNTERIHCPPSLKLFAYSLLSGFVSWNTTAPPLFNTSQAL